MVPVVAVHRSASALAVVMIALWLLGRDDPEMLALLAMICNDPALLVTALLMIALAMPETAEKRN